MSTKKINFKNLLKAKHILFVILMFVVLYVIYILIGNSLWNNKVKVTDKVLVSSTVISDKEFLNTVKFGSIKNVKNMLEAGANPKAIDESGRNAMIIAANFCNTPEIVKVLKTYNVDINHKDINGYTPLMFSIIANSSTEFLDELITNKANVNSTNNSGVSVLMIALAVGGNNLQTIEKLINKGADVNYKDPHNVTPLMVALRSSTSPKVVELLLKKGANPEARDDLGISAGDILRSNTQLSKYKHLLQKIPQNN